MAQWTGYMVSIKCQEDIGTFQGEIKSATNTIILLTKAFCNGLPVEGDVEIKATDIVDLKLIDKQTSASEEQHSRVTIARPVPKRAPRAHSTSEVTNMMKNTTLNGNGPHAKTKPIDIDYKQSGNTDSYVSHNKTPNSKKEKNKKWCKSWKDEECFGSPLDDRVNTEFDFEKNLALFNKQALWDELNSQRPELVRQGDPKRPAKYRHDENVLAGIPASSRQIIVPKQDFCEYVTDDGLIVPSISRALRKRLWEAADKAGLTWEKRIELMGRAATEISIQLLGGGHRLNPQNMHQVPTVVVLCGPHRHGAIGINTARHLASHGVRTIVFTTSVDVQALKKELPLYMLTKNRTVTNVSDLPSTSDLIICALCEDTDNPKQYPLLAKWVNKNKAPVLALDPPTVGTPCIKPKFSLMPVLPLPHTSSSGKLYLCNLGFPVDIFSEVGIKYKSPFGPKFIIPLHPRNE